MSENNLMADKLLKAIQEEERDKTRGRLKIFFGYAAGVGKTYAMLKAAHEAKQRGIDVIAGYIEPHARPKTAALLHGLEVLPSKSVPYNGITLREFDIDAALQRKILPRLPQHRKLQQQLPLQKIPLILLPLIQMPRMILMIFQLIKKESKNSLKK